MSSAVTNAEKLSVVCERGGVLILDGTFYVNFANHPEIGKKAKFRIKGGRLVFTGGKGFVLDDGSALSFDNVTMETISGVKLYLFNAKDKETRVDEISLTSCKIIGNILSRVKFEPSKKKKGGINTLSIICCEVDAHESDRYDMLARFWIENGGYFDKCVIERNDVRNMVGPFVWLSDRSALLTDGVSPCIVQDNTFVGAQQVSINSYHCATLIEVRQCYYRRNKISNFVNQSSANSATAYDNYLSCNELYYEDNTVRNIGAVSDAEGKRAYCEWGKSKAVNHLSVFSCRVFKGNYFCNTASELREAGVHCENDMKVSLFNFSTPFDELLVEDNTFTFDGGTIAFPQHALHVRSVKKIELSRNHFVAQRYTGSLVYCSADSNPVRGIEIKDNEFVSGDSRVVLTSFAEKKGHGIGSLTITGNKCSTGFSFNATNIRKVVYRDNETSNDGTSIVPVYYDFTGCEEAEVEISKHFPNAVHQCPDIFVGVGSGSHITYHVDNLKNVPYVQFRVVDDYELSLAFKQKGQYVKRVFTEQTVATRGALNRERKLDGKRIDASTLKGNRVSNPLQVAKLGIDNSIEVDEESTTKTIQISGRHSTWKNLQLDVDYGIDIVLDVQ